MRATSDVAVAVVVIPGCSPAVASSSSFGEAHCGSSGKSVNSSPSSLCPFSHSSVGGMSVKAAPVSETPSVIAPATVPASCVGVIAAEAIAGYVQSTSAAATNVTTLRAGNEGISPSSPIS